MYPVAHPDRTPSPRLLESRKHSPWTAARQRKKGRQQECEDRALPLRNSDDENEAPCAEDAHMEALEASMQQVRIMKRPAASKSSGAGRTERRSSAKQPFGMPTIKSGSSAEEGTALLPSASPHSSCPDTSSWRAGRASSVSGKRSTSGATISKGHGQEAGRSGVASKEEMSELLLRSTSETSGLWGHPASLYSSSAGAFTKGQHMQMAAGLHSTSCSGAVAPAAYNSHPAAPHYAFGQPCGLVAKSSETLREVLRPLPVNSLSAEGLQFTGAAEASKGSADAAEAAPSTPEQHKPEACSTTNLSPLPTVPIQAPGVSPFQSAAMQPPFPSSAAPTLLAEEHLEETHEVEVLEDDEDDVAEEDDEEEEEDEEEGAGAAHDDAETEPEQGAAGATDDEEDFQIMSSLPMDGGYVCSMQPRGSMDGSEAGDLGCLPSSCGRRSSLHCPDSADRFGYQHFYGRAGYYSGGGVSAGGRTPASALGPAQGRTRRRAPTPAGHLLGRTWEESEDGSAPATALKSGAAGAPTPLAQAGTGARFTCGASAIAAAAAALGKRGQQPDATVLGAAALAEKDAAQATPVRASGHHHHQKAGDADDGLADLMCDEVDFCTPPHSPSGTGRGALWQEAGEHAAELRRARTAECEAMFMGGRDAWGCGPGLHPEGSGALEELACQPRLHADALGAQGGLGYSSLHLGEGQGGPSTSHAHGGSQGHGGHGWAASPCSSHGGGSRWYHRDDEDAMGHDLVPVEALNTLEEFNAQLSKAMEASNWGRAERLWAELRMRSTIQPDMRTLNMLMRCLRKEVIHPDEAEQLMHEVCALGDLQPNHTTLTLLAEIRMRFEQLVCQ